MIGKANLAGYMQYMREWPKGWLWIKWHDCISDLTWSHLGVGSTELLEVAENGEIFEILLGLLTMRQSPEEKWVWYQW